MGVVVKECVSVFDTLCILFVTYSLGTKMNVRLLFDLCNLQGDASDEWPIRMGCGEQQYRDADIS